MITNNFMSSKGTRAERLMRPDSDNLEIMVNDMVIFLNLYFLDIK